VPGRETGITQSRARRRVIPVSRPGTDYLHNPSVFQALNAQRSQRTSANAIQLAHAKQFGEHRGYATGAMEPLAKILARRLHVHQQRNVAAEIHPVLRRDIDARVARHGNQVRLRIGRTADGRNGGDGIEK